MQTSYTQTAADRETGKGDNKKEDESSKESEIEPSDGKEDKTSKTDEE